MTCNNCGGVEGTGDRWSASEGFYSCDCPKVSPALAQDPRITRAVELFHSLTNRPQMYVYTKEAWLVRMDYLLKDLGLKGLPLRVVQDIYAAALVPNPYGNIAPLSELTDTVTNAWAKMASDIIRNHLLQHYSIEGL